jgi:hypothetical protein
MGEMKKGKYQIRNQGRLVEVDAHEWAIFGYGELIVHRDYNYPNQWTVSEPRTGYSIASLEKTKKAAMEKAAKDILHYYTPDSWAQAIKDVNKGLGKLPIARTRFEQENYD